MLHPTWSSIYYINRALSAFAKKSDGPVRIHQCAPDRKASHRFRTLFRRQAVNTI